MPDPVFRRPDAISALTSDEKRGRVLESNDRCALRGEGGAHRYFVRGVLPVRLLDGSGTAAWGLWAEVSETDATVIHDQWDAPDQSATPLMTARLANRVPGYPDTVGLPVSLQLTGPKSRPTLSFSRDSIHPFARECMAGVSARRVLAWLAGKALALTPPR
jgi:hypothetical protein